MVNIHINGQGPYHFAIDTGSTKTVIASELAQALGLVETSAGNTSGSDNSTEPERRYDIAQRTLGNLELRDIPAEPWDRHPLSPGGDAPHDILGTSVFADYLLIDGAPEIMTSIGDT